MKVITFFFALVVIFAVCVFAAFMDLYLHLNEIAPHDPVVEICPGVAVRLSEMRVIKDSPDLIKEACGIFNELVLKLGEEKMNNSMFGHGDHLTILVKSVDDEAGMPFHLISWIIIGST